MSKLLSFGYVEEEKKTPNDDDASSMSHPPGAEQAETLQHVFVLPLALNALTGLGKKAELGTNPNCLSFSRCYLGTDQHHRS